MGSKEARHDMADLDRLRRCAKRLKVRRGRRTQVPADVLDEARRLVDDHGFAPVAAALGVHFTTLQRWLEDGVTAGAVSIRSEAQFVEVSLPGPSQIAPVRIEITRPDGCRLMAELVGIEAMTAVLGSFCRPTP